MIAADDETSRGENFVKQADDLLTKELRRLSYQDRNDINEEIHGVCLIAPEETAEFLELSLVKLSTCLNQIVTDPPSLKIAYDLSQRYSNQTTESHEPATNEIFSLPARTYVNDRNFRLRFLRCELFDEKKAALRIIKYLDLVLEICGEYALKRPIQLDDLSKDEMKLLRSGCIQLLPYRDRAGRPVLAFVGDMGYNYNVRLKIKVLLYMLYVAGDIESQRKGLVILSCPSPDSVFSHSSFDDSHKDLVERLTESAPIRFCAIHACVPDSFLFRMIRPFIVRAISPSVRPRLKFTVATGIHRQYTFKGYGIPTDIIPLTDTGNVKMVFLRQWIKLRALLESGHGPPAIDPEEPGNILGMTYSSEPMIVEFPGSRDVLYRTGTTTSCHPGNAAFRELIESKLEEFQTGLDVSISMLADELIHDILRIRKGRFLKWDNRGYWTIMDDRGQTNAKVTASIRDFKRWKDAKTKMQSLDSSTHIFERQDLKRRKMLSGDNVGLEDTKGSTDATGTESRSFCFDL